MRKYEIILKGAPTKVKFFFLNGFEEGYKSRVYFFPFFESLFDALMVEKFVIIS